MADILNVKAGRCKLQDYGNFLKCPRTDRKTRALKLTLQRGVKPSLVVLTWTRLNLDKGEKVELI